MAISLASWNHPEPILELLEAFPLSRFFSHRIAEPYPKKNIIILDILETMRKCGLELQPKQILYIDDRDIHPMVIRSCIGRIPRGEGISAIGMMQLGS